MKHSPPVALFVYNRINHTKQTVEALQKNHGACKTTLYVYSDGPKNNDDKAGVSAVRSYVKNISGFADVILIEREQNLGLANSLIKGISEVLGAKESIIVLEDDLVTSPYFLQFMKDALRYYERDERVAAIHGYTFPLKTTLPETFFMRHTGCWGWGTWRRGWDLFETDGQSLLDQLQQLQLTTSFDMNGAYPYTQMLRNQVNGSVDSWAVRWHASTFIKDKLTLYPGTSLVKNIGHDGSGAHCTNSLLYDVNLTKSRVTVSSIPVCEDQNVTKQLEAYFRRGHSGMVRYWAWKLFGRG